MWDAIIQALRVYVEVKRTSREEHLSRLDPSDVTLHINVSVLHCDSVATLEETLKYLSSLPLHIARLGATSIAFPASEFHTVRRALQAQACYPRIVGRPERETSTDEGEP